MSGHQFGAVLTYQNQYEDEVYQAYGVVTLDINVEELISERQLKISKYDIWGDKDYYLSTEDLTGQWYVIDYPKYTAKFETYSPDHIGEDDGNGKLSYTLPDGRIIEKYVHIEGNTHNIHLRLMYNNEEDESNYLATYILSPRD